MGDFLHRPTLPPRLPPNSPGAPGSFPARHCVVSFPQNDLTPEPEAVFSDLHKTRRTEMAKLRALVNALARYDGREPEEINWYARGLREKGGQIPAGGRGGAAPEMTAEAATNLLIAINVTDNAAHAHKLVDIYRNLEAGASVCDEQDGVFAALSAAETFGKALEAAIAGAPELLASMWSYLDDAYNDPKNPGKLNYVRDGLLQGQHVRLSVIFQQPVPFAQILISTQRMAGWQVDHQWDFCMSPAEASKWHARTIDRSVQSCVGIKTLLQLYLVVLGNQALTKVTRPIDIEAMLKEEFV